jgi:hypothetical protein
MDENAISITMSNAHAKHQISFESDVLGMKLANMTCTHVTYFHTENTQKKIIVNRIFVQHKIVSGVKRVELLSEKMS